MNLLNIFTKQQKQLEEIAKKKDERSLNIKNTKKDVLMLDKN